MQLFVRSETECQIFTLTFKVFITSNVFTSFPCNLFFFSTKHLRGAELNCLSITSQSFIRFSLDKYIVFCRYNVGFLICPVVAFISNGGRYLRVLLTLFYRTFSFTIFTLSGFKSHVMLLPFAKLFLIFSFFLSNPIFHLS